MRGIHDLEPTSEPFGGSPWGRGSAGSGERRREQREEENKLTKYGRADLAEDWEFKILRSVMGRFWKQELLSAALEKEAEADWELVRQLDGKRVRLKRPASAKANDESLDFDPYHTFVGMSELRFMLISLAVFFTVTSPVWIFLCVKFSE